MLVSIIIPCYNVESYIAECLDSVFAQTYYHMEVICIDNNSTDRTYAILEGIKSRHPELIIAKETKTGAPAARNKGLSLAKGEWIQFLDADDLLLPNKIEHQIHLVNEHPTTPFVAAATFLQNLEGTRRIKLAETDSWKGLFTTSLGITSANLFNNRAILQIGAWNENIKSSQEYDLMFRLIKELEFPIIDNEPLTVIRERATGQISQSNPSLKWRQYLELRLQILDFISLNFQTYYEKNKNWFHQELFKILRVYSRYDIQHTAEINKEYLGNSFRPNVQSVKSMWYRLLYPLMGFKKIQLLYNIIKPS